MTPRSPAAGQTALGDTQTPSAPAPSRRRRSVRVRVGVLLAVALLAMAGAAMIGDPLRSSPDSTGADAAADPAPSALSGPASWERAAVDADGLLDRVGVRLVQVAVSGGGGLLDLRDQVLDPTKAAIIHDQANPPALVDNATGVVASGLLMGHTHSAPFKAGQVYYYVFENPGNIVQRGDDVSVLLGDVELEHVSVR